MLPFKIFFTTVMPMGIDFTPTFHLITIILMSELFTHIQILPQFHNPLTRVLLILI